MKRTLLLLAFSTILVIFQAFSVSPTPPVGYTITASAGAHGSISPSGAVPVTGGGSATFTITPDGNASIDDISVDGVSQGPLTSYTFNNVVSDHAIAATFIVNSFTITATAGTHGSITPSGFVPAEQASTPTFTFSPNPGYHIQTIKVDNILQTLAPSYTFSSILANHSIAVSFAIDTFTITATKSGNGTITPSGINTVLYNATVNYSFAPASGYHIGDVSVDGISKGTPATYQFLNVRANHLLNVSFINDTTDINDSTGGHGSVLPAGHNPILLGSSFTAHIVPETGYHILDVIVDGGSRGPVDSVQFTSISAQHAVYATFGINTYSITSSTDANGAISPLGLTPVTYGGSQSFGFTPQHGYHLAGLIVDGASIPSPSSPYTFSNIQGNHTIAVSFAADTFSITASAGSGGSVSSPGISWVTLGGSKNYTITPAAGHHILDVLVDGVSQGRIGTYNFSNVDTNHNLNATFGVDSATITVSNTAGGTVTPGTINLPFGGSQTFTITADPLHTIEDVVVDGVGQGPVPTYRFNNVQANHTIAVSFTINSYTITASAGTGGSISPSGAVSVDAGGSKTFTITANPHYHIKDVLVNGSSVGVVSSYPFTNVAANQTISASFAIDSVTVTASILSGNGSITPAGVVMVPYNGSKNYTITAATGWHITGVWVNDTAKGVLSTFNFTGIKTAQTIKAAFAIDSFTITASATGSGTISPNGAVPVFYGASQSFTLSAAAGHHVASFLVDGVAITPVPQASYQFDAVNANHTVQATFAIDSFTITASAGLHGTISPLGETTVLYGDGQSYTITPDPGYHIATVTVDESAQPLDPTYNFTSVQSNHAIEVMFAANTYSITATSTGNGNITPAGVTPVNDGDSLVYSITATAGHHIFDVLVDGISVGSVSSHTFANITASHTISASFAVDTFAISETHTVGGTVSPSGTVNVTYGASQAFTFTPDGIHSVEDVIIDGVGQGPLPGYTFTNVHGAHTLSVSFVTNSFTITARSGANGTITPGGAVSVDAGGSKNFTITANQHYHIIDVLADSVSVGAVSSYNFTNVTRNHTLDALFGIDSFAIVATVATGNGTITPSGTSMVPYNTGRSYAITPDAGWHIADVMVNGVSQGAINSYPFTGVKTAQSISASFVLDSFTITASSDANGTISPDGVTHLAYGSSQAYIITPNPNFYVASLVVDGIAKTPAASYSFDSVKANHTISVTFTIDTFSITASNGPNGTVTPSGLTRILSGGSQTYTITANAGYHTVDVLIDGVSTGSIGSHTFSAVTGNHTISASFALDSFTITESHTGSGTVTPSGAVLVGRGLSQLFTFTADPLHTIEDVVVDGVGQGPVPTYQFNNVQANHTIAVSFAINSYTITASAGTGGSISPSGAVSVDAGGSKTFTITANPHYHIKDALVNGSSVGVVSSYPFTNVAANQTISASFAIDSVTVTASILSGNGAITPAGTALVPYNGSQSYTITADAGWHITGIWVNDTAKGVLSNYTFTGIKTAQTIKAAFAIDSFTITASATGSGTISPNGAVPVFYGASQSFTLSAAAGHHVASFLVDGVAITPVPQASYQFDAVNANHTVQATFAIDSFTITASAGLHGTISPLGETTVLYGDGQSYTITPDPGYHIATVTVDESAQSLDPTYNFTSVQSNHAIEVMFAANTYSITATSTGNGNITPAGVTPVNYGDSLVYSITATAGHHIFDVLVDGISVGSVSSHTFANITASHTISASFAVDTFAISETHTVGGTVSPSGTVNVTYGASQAFTFTPDGIHSVEDVIIDGVGQGPLPGYTFTNVHGAHTLSVSFVTNSFTITARSGANGTITPGGAVSVDAGGSKNFTITANQHYHIIDVLADSVSVGAVSSYNFTNVTRNHTLDALFGIDSFAIVAIVTTGNGTISPLGTTMVPYNTGRSYAITPDAGWHIADVMVNGVSQGAINSYPFTGVKTAQSISASFVLDSFTITASSGANGTISPDGVTHLAYGSSQAYTITPNPNFYVASLVVDGIAKTPAASYSFDSVKANHTISVTFTIDTFSITASNGPNGTVTPSGLTRILSGGSQTYTITANAGYHTLDVLVDGVSAGRIGSHTFSAVTGNHTISASFALDSFTITESHTGSGTVTPSGAVLVGRGLSQLFTFTADPLHTIEDVVVDGVGQGPVPTYQFNNVQANHTIAVSFAINTYTITASAGTGGSISPSGAVSVDAGGSKTFTITANPHYHIKDVLVNGSSVGAVSSYPFTTVAANQIISASFAIDSVTVTASILSGNGAITPAGTALVPYNGSKSYTITADAGWHITGIWVNDTAKGVLSNYTFTGIKTAQTIKAAFAIDSFTITASATGSGTISPNGAVPVFYGASQSFTLSAAAGHHVASFLVDGVAITPVPQASYQFDAVNANHTVQATFAIDSFTITASAGLHGTISPLGETTVLYGDGQSYTITPDPGYHIATVTVDESAQPLDPTYNFTNVQSNHAIEVMFAANTYSITATSTGNGNITPAGVTPVNYGDSLVYSITATAGHHIFDVLVDGISVGSVSSHTFTNITASHTISASFGIDTLTISETHTSGGTVSPSGAVSVIYGVSQAFTFTADPLYSVEDVVVDGVGQGPLPGYTFSNVHDSHTLSVSFVTNSFTITARSGANGTITPGGAVSVDAGGNKNFVITANQHYHIIDVLADSVSVGAVSSYGFTNVTRNHTLDALFGIDSFAIVATVASGNGTISPLGTTMVPYNTGRSYAITPDAGWHIADVIVNGVSQGAINSYPFTGVKTAQSISASFAIDSFTISASASGNGTISPEGNVHLAYGQNQEFLLSAAAGHHVAGLTVDGQLVVPAPQSSYQLDAITANHTVIAAFAIDSFTITASAGSHGTISPLGVTDVTYGSSQSYVIRPDSGYHILSVMVDQAPVALDPLYAFSNIQAGHSIEVTFAINAYSIDATVTGNGNITPIGTNPFNWGDTQVYTITPATGHHTADVLVDGISQGPIGSYGFSDIRASHTISASFALDSFTITASSDANGTISPNGVTHLGYGSSQAYTITPNPNFYVASLVVDGIAKTPAASYSFDSVKANHTISVTFTIDTFSITASNGPNGTVTPSGLTRILSGGSQTYTITANAGYHTLDVLVDGVSAGRIAGHTFSAVTGNHAISASFALDSFTITESHTGSGTVTPSGAVLVGRGLSQLFTFTADPLHTIEDVVVDGVGQGPVPTYQFNNVQANHTIAVSFAINTYTITASAGTGGSISPSGAVSVDAGGSKTFTITANPHYHIKDVLVNGSSVGVVSSYPFTNVAANQTISASFAIDSVTITASILSGNGSITPAGVVMVPYNGSKNYTITAATGWHITGVWVNDTAKGVLSTFNFTGIKTAQTIKAAFAIDSFTITASATGSGTISPNGAVPVFYGASQSFTLSAAAGHHVASFLVDGVAITPVPQASYQFDAVNANHTVQATFAIDSFTITASAGLHGTISPLGATTVLYGNIQSYAITPDPGYHIATVTVDESAKPLDPTYEFTNVQSSHFISVTFAINTYSITATSTGNGNITPAGVTPVNHGDTLVYSITATTGHHILDVLVDGISIGSVANHTFANITGNHTISASFGIDTLTISETHTSGGTVSPSGAVSVIYGESQAFTFTADPLYSVEDVVVDGVGQGPLPGYTFNNVHGAHTLSVSFVINSFTITARAGANGVITPGGVVSVNAGGSKNFTITANQHYHIVNVLADSVSVGVVSSYGFTNVTRNHTLDALFGIDSFAIVAIVTTGNGTISPLGTTMVPYNTGKSYTITPDAGWHIADVIVNGISQGAINSYPFTGVKTAQSISASFAIDSFTISASASGNGTISPEGNVHLAYGQNQEFTLSAAAGHHVAGLTVDGQLVVPPPQSSYRLDAITANHTVIAAFAVDSFTITSSAGSHGTISPVGVTDVTYGSSQSYAIRPDSGYHIFSVMIDQAPAALDSVHDFSNIQSGHSIEVTFAINAYTIAATTTGNGNITPTGTTPFNWGDTQVYTIIPATGHHTADVLVDGISQGPIGSYNFSNIRTNHTISAAFAIDSFTITASSDANGTISPDGVTHLAYGSSQAYTITPNPNFYVASLVVDGIAKTPAASYSFDSVKANHTISVTFTIDTFSITASNGPNGTVTPSGLTRILSGGSQTYTITANAGYHTLDVLVDGVSAGRIAGHTFSAVTGNHAISASFALDSFTITESHTGSGTVTPSGAVLVGRGLSQLFTFTADPLHTIEDVVVDGVGQGPVPTYRFNNVQANHTIAVSFAINSYTITASAGTGGSISPSGAVSVDAGGNKTFTITANPHYHIKDVLVNGSSVGVVSSYPFTNVAANQTISASFAIDSVTITASILSGNGSITPAGVLMVPYNGSKNYTISAATGWHITGVWVNDTAKGVLSTFNFTGIKTAQTIKAAFAIDSFTITASATGSGTISPNGAVPVFYGASQSFTLSAAAGHHVASFLVDGVAITPVPQASYQFDAVNANHTVQATFAIDSFTITASAGLHGTVSPVGQTTVLYGNGQSYTITPDPGYHIATVTVDESVKPLDPTYSFTDVQSNHSISVTFAINTYSITATSTGNGNLTPAGVTPVNYGDTLVYSIAPATGHHIIDVVVDGISVGKVLNHTFANITASHTISASFGIDSFTIIANNNEGGVLSPNGTMIITYGGSQKFTIVADSIHSIEDVLVDNVSVGPETTHTFSNISANHTITVNFVINTFTIVATRSGNGTITPSGAVSVNAGSSKDFTFLPDPGNHITGVTVDNAPMGILTHYQFSNIMGNHSLAVAFGVDSFTIVASVTGNGSISPAGTSDVTFGSASHYTITPGQGWHLLNVVIDGVSHGLITSYDFANITQNHTIGASFGIDSFTITATSGPNGSVTPAGAITVTYGGSRQYSMDASIGHHVDSVWVDGSLYYPIGQQSHTSVLPYTFDNVIAGHTIRATFAIDSFTVDANPGQHGVITPAGQTTVAYGANLTLAITPDSGYHVVNVFDNESSLGTVSSVPLTNIVANHNISASFAIDTFTITASAGANGSIAPAGVTRVLYDGSREYTFTPSFGYHVSDVMVDGNSVGVLSAYTFNNVRAGHTISVSFGLDTLTVTATFTGNGTMNPSGDLRFPSGATQNFVFTPSDHHRIDSVVVDGVSIPVVASYQFSNITTDHSLRVVFVPIYDTIYASSNSNGTISPSGTVLVVEGSNQKFVMHPAYNSHIVDVVIDGASMGSETTYTFSNVTARHTIAVEFAINTYTITASASGQGSIVPDGAVVMSYGSNRSFTITPNTGNHIVNVFVDETPVGAVTTYPFNNVTANHTIHAVFGVDSFFVNAAAGPHGTIDPVGQIEADYHSAKTFTFTPETGYHVVSVFVDSVTVGAPSSYQFTNIEANHSIAVNFGINVLTITVSTGHGGSIAPANPVNVDYGNDQTVTIVPDQGYHVTDVLVDGVSVGPILSYVFQNVTTNHTVVAVFSNTYTITASAGNHGSVTPSGVVQAIQGLNQTFNFSPQTGYHVVSVLVDSVNLGPMPAYTFTDIQGNHTLAVAFAVDSATFRVYAGAHGRITPGDSLRVPFGTDQTFAIIPDTGYHIVDVIVDGFTKGVITSFTFTSVNSDHSIQAVFAVNTYSIIADTVGSGTITPYGTLTFEFGQSQSYQIAPAQGYHIADVMVDNRSVGRVAIYSFDAIGVNHHITAIFSNTYTVIAGVTGNDTAKGTISPRGTVTAIQDSDITFTITPKTGHHIFDVMVDSLWIGPVSSYTFPAVMTNHSIYAKFAVDTFTISTTWDPNTFGHIDSTGGVRGTQGKSYRVTYGANAAFKIVPETGYFINSLFADTTTQITPIPATKTYTFTNVTRNHTLWASFDSITNTVNITVGPHGTVTPNSLVTLKYGMQQTYIVHAGYGYHIDSILVDKKPRALDTSFTFTADTGWTHTIKVDFAINQYTLTVQRAAIGGAETVTPSKSLYHHGDTVTLQAVSAVGYQSRGWFGDTTTTDSTLVLVMRNNITVGDSFVVQDRYLTKYRTAEYVYWTQAKDQFGKLKPVKRKPDKIDFKFRLNASVQGGASKLALTFTTFSSGKVTTIYKGDSIEIRHFDSVKTAIFNFNGDTVREGQMLYITGRYYKGTGMKINYAWGTEKKNTIKVFDYSIQRLPMPNLHNVGEELFKNAVGTQDVAYPNGLYVGAPVGKNAPNTVFLKKYTNVQTSMNSSGVIHTGMPTCLANIKKALTSYLPNKHSDSLFAELLTLKLNIGASATGRFPVGFGQMVYLDTASIFNNLLVDSIRVYADTIITCQPKTRLGSVTYSELNRVLHRLNSAFSVQKIDTLSFKPKTVMTGAKSLIDVPYMCLANGIVPVNIIPPGVEYIPVPDVYTLYQNYPNPFNPTTNIEFNLPYTSTVTLKVYNMLGQEMSTLLDHQQLEDGDQTVEFNAANLASGVYFYQLTAAGVDEDGVKQQFTKTKKMILVK